VFNASKTIAVIASNISFPLMIPPILYASLVLGRLTLGDDQSVFWPWVLGSFILAALAAAAGSILTFALVASYQRIGRKKENKNREKKNRKTTA
jgi:uncharacterized protein (DUF2062 family)